MLKKIALLVVAAGLASAASAAPKKAAKPAASATLAAGQYTARVGMLACEECGPNIEKVLNSIHGVEHAKVDSDKLLVSFAVKPGAKVKVAELQTKLKAKADEMGMGADYRLSKITELKKADQKS